MDHVSATLPSAVGVKTTVSVRLVPGASVVPSARAVEALKGPVTGGFDLVMVRFWPPVLLTVNDSAAVEPSCTGP